MAWTLTPEGRKRIAEAKIGKKNPQWKGNKVTYRALHAWVRRHKPVPKNCEQCGGTQKQALDTANISGKYKRNLSDWEYLCRKCHMKKDGRLAKFKEDSSKRSKLKKRDKYGKYIN